MKILTHGRDMSLAPTLTPIVRQRGHTMRGALDALAPGQFKAVQLDATLSGLRPRELDQRGRRDLLALLTRRDLRLAGLDLFFPRSHFQQSQHLDRAMTATLAAIGLAADLGRVPLSVALPVEDLNPDVKSALVEAADGHSIRLAVHAEDQLDALGNWVEEVDLPALGFAIDPASLLAQGKDPVEIAQGLGKTISVARLSDLSSSETLRCFTGSGELDVIGFRVALDLATGRTGPVVLDLRGLDNPLGAATAACEAWHQAAFTI